MGNFSNANAIIVLIESILKVLDDKKLTCEIFQDLEKAFGTGDNKLLLKSVPIYLSIYLSIYLAI